MLEEERDEEEEQEVKWGEEEEVVVSFVSMIVAQFHPDSQLLSRKAWWVGCSDDDDARDL